MSILTTRLKGFIVLASTAAVLSLVYIPAARADDSTAAPTTPATPSSGLGGDASLYLQEISQYTNGILAAVNNLPSYLVALSQLAISWLSPDTSDTTAKLQGTFATYATQIASSSTAQNAMSVKMAQDFFGSQVTTTSLPYANDLDYNSLLGSPLFSPDPRNSGSSGAPAIDNGFNYIENASGVTISHAMPSSLWSGTKADQLRYTNFYRAVSSVQTYDAFILGQLYTDNQAQIPASQAALLTQASTSDWFAQVASEQIGIVLRQILMYNSQTFLLLSQLLQTEKQLLATQAMTNTLLIANGSTGESLLLQKAIQRIGS